VDEQRIWAPWRMAYVSGDDFSQAPVAQPSAWLDGADASCFLCRAAAQYDNQEESDRNNLVVERTTQLIAVLNRYPYTNGHLLISPLRHAAELADLSDAERLESIGLLDRYSRRLTELIHAQGFNIGLNLGSVAGAGVPGHLHWHLVPRWSGDVNFMTSVASVRMISQSLESLWESLAAAES